MIKPSVGRVVWYYEDPGQTQPFAAIIAYVHSDTRVNLSVFDADGRQYASTGVQLLQDGQDTVPYPFCKWMPYQVGQAAKTEELEKKLSQTKTEC